MIRELVVRNRSYRRFYQETGVELDTLKEFVDLARSSASGGNRQALKYILCRDPERNAAIFPHIGLAGSPREGERPSAYIIILGDTEISGDFGVDHGIAAQSILLGATEKGLGGCMVGMINRNALRKTLGIPSRYEVLLLLAMGKPKEEAVIDTVGEDGNTGGWWDDQGVRHVPKRPLDDIIVAQY